MNFCNHPSKQYNLLFNHSRSKIDWVNVISSLCHSVVLLIDLNYSISNKQTVFMNVWVYLTQRTVWFLYNNCCWNVHRFTVLPTHIISQSKTIRRVHSPHFDAMYRTHSVHVLSSDITEKSNVIPKNNHLFFHFLLI